MRELSCLFSVTRKISNLSAGLPVRAARRQVAQAGQVKQRVIILRLIFALSAFVTGRSAPFRAAFLGKLNDPRYPLWSFSFRIVIGFSVAMEQKIY